MIINLGMTYRRTLVRRGENGLVQIIAKGGDRGLLDAWCENEMRRAIRDVRWDRRRRLLCVRFSGWAIRIMNALRWPLRKLAG